jgi:hypothetical protein
MSINKAGGRTGLLVIITNHVRIVTLFGQATGSYIRVPDLLPWRTSLKNREGSILSRDQPQREPMPNCRPLPDRQGIPKGFFPAVFVRVRLKFSEIHPGQFSFAP